MKAEHLADVGDIVVTRVREYEHDRDPEVFFDDATEVRRVLAEQYGWVGNWCDDQGRLRLTFQAFVLQTPDATILVDPCIGNDRERFFLREPLRTTFKADLADVVGGLEAIDLVAFTHLHFDHIGWSTDLVDGRWEPMFPGTRHVVVGDEWEHWRDDAVRDPETDFARAIGESIRPLFEHDLVDLVDDDHELTHGVRLRSTAGHSPGHVAIDITSRGERALITGDLIHHPIQVHEPRWPNRFDEDVARGVQVRTDIVDELADTGALMLGTHFAGRSAGYVERDGGRRWFRAVGS